MRHTRKKVIIVGGGFGGLNAAKSLEGDDRLEVLLIDRQNYHLFQPLLYQVATAGGKRRGRRRPGSRLYGILEV